MVIGVFLCANFMYKPDLMKAAYYHEIRDPYENRSSKFTISYKNASYLLKKYKMNLKKVTVPKQQLIKTKHILIMEHLLDGIRKNHFEVHRCAEQCDLVTDIEKADAVIIPPRLLFKYHGNIKIPQYRRPDQYWVFYCLDHTLSIYYSKIKDHLGSFNLTMTWRPDADVHIGYGYVEKLNRSKPVTPMKAILAKKTKLVAWVVSNCWPQSRRGLYVKELQKYISVDIYGRCGIHFC